MSPLRLALIGSLVVVVLTGLARPSQDGSAGSPVLAEPVQLSLGLEHTCSLQQAGDVLCWGQNDVGQLGAGAGNTAERTKPGPVTGLSDAANALAVGGQHTCALLADSGAQCWGWNRYGQLGDGTQDPPLFPNPVPVDVRVQFGGARLLGIGAIDAGGVHTCALMSATGGLKCWGWDGYGQIGAGQSCGSNICLAPRDVTGLTSGVIDVGLGENHGCAVTNGGSVQCWGLNDAGQLGATTTDTCGTPPLDLPCSTTPLTVEGLSGVVDVSAGERHTCALTDGGAVKCWGDNSSGQLGDGGACGALCAAPVDVTGLGSGVTAIAAGGNHTCALVATGARCWGSNAFGQLGDGGACGTVCAAPVQVADIGIAPDAIDAGSHHTCAILSLRIVLCWGRNHHGQLGDATRTNRLTPVTVLGLGELPDTDRDGCTNGQELGPDAAFGGQRNPNKFWDVFDTPDAANTRDAIISTGDILRVVARFGTTGVPGSPLDAPAPTGYHAAFDRSPPVPGDHAWALNGPDGAVTTGDVFASVVQFGHTCAGSPP